MGSAKPSYVESKEPKAKVKPSNLGKKGNTSKPPKGSTEKLKGGNKKVKQTKNSAGH